MLYQLKHAQAEAKIVKQCMREGLSLPKWIADAPTLQLGLQLYYDAFFDLDTCRSAAFSVGPIPWLAIREYAKVYEFSEEQTDDLFYHIRQMDVAYIDHCQPKKKGKPTWGGLQASANSQHG